MDHTYHPLSKQTGGNTAGSMVTASANALAGHTLPT